MWLIALLLPLLATARFPSPPIFTSVQHYPPICYLPPDSGLCSSSSTENNIDLFTRYYFDSTTQECYPFGVQACGGNENRFKTKTDCESYCRMDIKGQARVSCLRAV